MTLAIIVWRLVLSLLWPTLIWILPLTDFFCRVDMLFDAGLPHELLNAFLGMLRHVPCVEARLHEVLQQSRATCGF